MSYETFKKAVELIHSRPELLEKIYPQKEETILLAEKTLGVKFPPLYKKFLNEFGTLEFGSTNIYGIWKETLDGGPQDIVVSTIRNREKYNTFHKYIIIYDGGDGFYCALDTSETNSSGENPVKGGYGLFLPDDDIEIEERYEDFGDFLLNRVAFQIEISDDTGASYRSNELRKF